MGKVAVRAKLLHRGLQVSSLQHLTCAHLKGREQHGSAGPKGFLLLGEGK